MKSIYDVVDRDEAPAPAASADSARDELFDDSLAALRGLVAIIDAAGLLNLSNGVQLGQTAWYVKASDRLEWAREVIARAPSVEVDRG